MLSRAYGAIGEMDYGVLSADGLVPGNQDVAI